MIASTDAASFAASGGNRSRRPAGSSAGLTGGSSVMAEPQLSAIRRQRNTVRDGSPFTVGYEAPAILERGMLFHTPAFLFGFLPLVLGGFYLAARWGARAGLLILILASMAF